jgi:hypothetical protein
MTGDLLDRVQAMTEEQRAPEIVSVLAVDSDAVRLTPALAELVGPLLAQHLHPGMRFGETLHVERVAGGFIVDVEVK